MTDGRALWIDATAGVAGDMLLAALVDAGARSAVVEAAVAAVVPEVDIGWEDVSRNGFRARRAVVTATRPAPHRHAGELVDLVAAATLAPRVRELALAALDRLARAEALVHGMPLDRVHLHEVGAWDSLADIVGACAALVDLGVTAATSSPIELGSGRIVAEHGDLPVPAPGVAELVRDWQVRSTRIGEAATPTGVALLRAWCVGQAPGPTGRVVAVGVGAGRADPPGLANVVRVVVLDPYPGQADQVSDHLAPSQGLADPAPAHLDPVLGHPPEDLVPEPLLELAANVDDLDPRAWPSVLDALLTAGALDAWLTPIVMKKGRPAHTVHTLVRAPERAEVTAVLLRHTTTLGVRATEVSRVALARGWVLVPVFGVPLPVKVAHARGGVVHALVEADEASAVARQSGRPLREVFDAARAAASAAGLVPGAPVPADLLSHRPEGLVGDSG